MVNFWTDWDHTHIEMASFFASLAADYGEPGILTFARANADDMRDLTLRYCKWDGKQSFVVFKNGKQVAINGVFVIGAQQKALKAAAEKLCRLAKKRLAERQQALDSRLDTT